MDYFTIANNWFSWFTTFIQINIRERGDRSILHFWFQYYQKFVYSYIIQKKKHIITHLFQFPPYSSPLSLMSHLDKGCEPGEPIIGNHIAVLCKNPNPCRTKYFIGLFWRTGGTQAKESAKCVRMGCAASYQNKNGPMKYFFP